MTRPVPQPAGPVPINIDVSITQDPINGERGIPAYTRDFVLEFEHAHDPERFDPLWVFDDEWPPPPSLDAIANTGRLIPFSRIDEFRRPAVTHLLSPFYGPKGAFQTRRWIEAQPVPVAMTVYDLVPLLMPEKYLPMTDIKARYLASLEWVRHADALLTISEFTRRDVIKHLGVGARRVTAVGTGVSGRFAPPECRDTAFESAEAQVPGLRSGFVMYTAGSDPRKNVERLLEAYARVPRELREAHQLAIVFKLHENRREELESLARALGIADELLLTDLLSDSAILAMYQSTELFVFPSLYEGFGLPVAEALAAGAVAIAGENTSLPEVLPDADARFDAENPDAIATAIVRGLTDSAFRTRARATAQAVDHSWTPVIKRSSAAYERLARRG